MARIPFVWIACMFSLGILGADFFSVSLLPMLIIFAVIISAIFFSWKRRFLKSTAGIWILLLFVLAGVLRYSLWKENNLEQPYVQHLPIKADSLEAVVHSLSGGARIKAVMELQRLFRNTLAIDLDGKVLVYFPYRFKGALLPGRRYMLSDIRLESLPEPRNPGQFDYGGFLRLRGIVAQCRLANSRQISSIAPTGTFFPGIRIFYPVRKYLMRNIEACFEPLAAGYMKALLLGNRDTLSSKLKEDFQQAGVMHVLAISGLHVGFIVLIFHVLLSFFPIYFKLRNFLIMALLIFYMFLTGNQPPVMRATMMSGFFLLATNLERRGAIYNYLFGAAFLMLFFQPQQLFWVGFQFSVIAVLSIVYCYEKLEPLKDAILERFYREKTRMRLKKWLVVPFLVSLAAQLGTLPLTMHYFHSIPLFSVLLNVLVIPWTAAILAGGFLFLFLSGIHAPLAELLANFLTAVIQAQHAAVSATADLPGAYLNISAFGYLEIMIYLAGLLLLLNVKQRLQRRVYTAVMITLLVIFAATQLVQPRYFNLMILDVGQGDAALITTPQKRVVLVDTGPANDFYNAAEAAIIPLMQHLEIRTIDHLFISHPHLDHIGGTFRLLEYARIDSVYLPRDPLNYYWHDSLLQALSRAEIPYRYLEIGDRIQIDRETRVYVLGPPQQLSKYDKSSGSNLNNNSLVLKIQHRDKTMLFTGDVEKMGEVFLTLWGGVLKSDFLKVPHHGSNTSTSEDFLALVNPEFAAISVGIRNKYGLPSPKVLKRLAVYDSKVLRTDQQKAIWMQLKHGKWRLVNWAK